MSSKDILDLIRQALAEIDQPTHSLASIVRKAIRVACQLEDHRSHWWLEYELVPLGDNEGHNRIISTMRKNYSKEDLPIVAQKIWDRYQSNRKIMRVESGVLVVTGKYNHLSVQELEENNRTIDTWFAAIAKQPTTNDVMGRGQAVLRGMEIPKQRAIQEDIKRILKRIELRVFHFLSNAEKQVIFAEQNVKVFEEYQRIVDSKIMAIAPEAAEQFKEAYNRINQESEEAWSQAALSCRRVLKAVADALYPPQQGLVKCLDGKERLIGDDQFKNRLWQYIAERVKGSATGDLLLSQIDDLGHKIDRLYEIASKGTHSKITKNEIYQCIIQTYLTIGDILTLSENPK